ncbi:MAG TPA: DUF1592 domain-containing protein [Polyangiales bacterium]|nr:DUF1592 domain-containing protein [Polyangiales bacterium]
MPGASTRVRVAAKNKKACADIRWVFALIACAVTACRAVVEPPEGVVPGGAVGPAAGAVATGAAGAAAANASGATAAGAAGGSAAGMLPGTPAQPGSGAPIGELLPARIRRLSNHEFDASASALLGIESKFAASFTPDTRQDFFTRNDAQRIDPVYMTQLDDAAKKLAEMAKGKVDQLAPCANAAQGGDACATEFISKFAARAYRRPATMRETDALVSLYRAGAEGATYADGIGLVVQAVLMSPGFLYLSELGDASGQLTDFEIASQLSYLFVGAPPDDALLQAAAAGQLQNAAMRQEHARRLMMDQRASAQITRMVEEWLGIDRIADTAKDSNVYPEFAGLRDAMQKEADAFVTEALWKRGGTVSDLMTADWTPAEDSLARMYLNMQGGNQITRTDGMVSLASVRRRGILGQGAFLSVYAHAHETAPVLRGVAVLRRVLCMNIPAPTSLNVNIVPPVQDASKTTRERFAVHSKDSACSSCHKTIDPIGFSFEWLDGMGRERMMENGHPIDSSAQLMAGLSVDGSYPDSAALSAKIGTSPELASCFAKRLFHSAAAANTDGAAVEQSFVAQVEAMPPESRGKLQELLVAFAGSELFVKRGAQ